MSSVADLVYELPHELPKELRLRKLENIRKTSNLSRHIASAQSPSKNLDSTNNS